MIETLRRHGAQLALVLGATALLTACSGGATASDASRPAGDPVTGGTLQFRISTDAGCIDPHQARLRAVLGVGRQIVDSLTFQKTDGSLEPWLAESWKVNDAGTEFTFNLRNGVTFSDGTALTAQVVKANFEAIASMGSTASIAGPYLSGLSSVNAADDHTVTVAFNAPNAQFLQATSTPSLGIVAASTLALDAGSRCSGGIVGTGAFTLASFRANEAIELVRRSGYSWAPASFANQRDAYLQGITYRSIADASIAAGMLRSGEIDAIWDVGNTDTDRLLKSGYVVTDRANPGIPMSLILFPRNGALQSLAVRKAVQAAVDVKAAAAAALPSTLTPSTGVLSQTTPGYSDLSATFAYDPEKAADLLDKDGWTKGADGIRTKNGERLTIRANIMTPTTYIPFMEFLQAQLAASGIALEIRQLTPAEDNQDRVAGTQQVRLNAVSRADPGILTAEYRGFDSHLDSLLDRQSAATDQAARFAIVNEASKYIIDQGYALPVHDLVLSMGYSDKTLHGITSDATNTPSFQGAWLTR